MLLNFGIHFCENSLLEILIIANIFLRGTILLGPSLGISRIWNNYGYKEVLHRVSIDKDLSNFANLAVNVL